MGMPAIAVTDHSNLFGAVELQKTCGRSGVKPIFGSQINVVHGDDHRAYHLVLLARTLEGYFNLSKLISRAHRETPPEQPWVEAGVLAEYAEGLLALTGDLGGAIPQSLLRNQPVQARQILAQYREIFGADHVFIEIQRHEGLPELDAVNPGLIELAEETRTPLVATNDCHYLDPEHTNAQTVLMCIGMDKRVDLEDLERFPVRDLYLKSPQEMAELFADLPEAVANTERVAALCDVQIPLGKVFLPQYQVPEGYDIASYFEHLARQGLSERLEELRALGMEPDVAVYEARLETEIAVIEQMDFPGYFLIVWDFIAYARQQGIPVGPGRGSGAGSLVAYSLRITNVDPLQYGLLFERFLNPERVSMPDFDIDFCMNRRGEVIEYVTRRYGVDNVGQIITFGQLKARACIRDIARVLNLPFSEADRLAKLIPEELGITLDDAFQKEPRLREAIAGDERLGHLWELARAIEGTNRNLGMHAAGIVISDGPLTDFVPVTRGVNGELVTQYAKDEVEAAGLVKFDFLGLRNLTVIDDAVRMLNAERPEGQPPLDIDALPLDDAKVYRLLSSGETAGVFQMESSGFQELMRKLRPDCFEDIIAAGALYRPGPLGSGMVDLFCDCKHGLQAPKYPHPSVKGILEETYGVIVYQEQVMQLAQIMSGYTLGGADLLRRAMGKKKHEVMVEQRAIFVGGAEKNGIAKQVAEEVFDNIAAFASYGFNKSHATAYGLVTYQTAYLKAHHPVHFMAALMTADADRTDRVVRLIHEATSMGIQVLPPDVNASALSFAPAKGTIRFGLSAIKGVGHGAIEAILAARAEAPFTSLYDLCERVDLHRVNRRVLETLVKCGALDSLAASEFGLKPGDLDALGRCRGALFAAIATALKRGQKAQADRDMGQASLFDLFAAAPSAKADEPPPVVYADAEPWSDKVLLEAEKECLGFYVSGHPLDRYAKEIELYASHDTRRLEKAEERATVKLAGVVESIRERRSKTGDARHAFVMVEDLYGRAEVLVFSKVLPENEDMLKSGQPLLIHGSVRIEGDEEPRERKILCERVQLLSEARLEMVKRVTIRLESGGLTKRAAESLRAVLADHPGSCATEISLEVGTVGRARFALPEGLRVAPTDELLSGVERLLGRGTVLLS
jgi:DNA polymerase-3 subunit alpha